MSPLLDAVLSSAWAMLALKVTALVAIAAAVQFLLRRSASAATRHGIWALAVVTLLLLPPLSTVAPQWTVRVPLPESAAARPDAFPAADAVHSPVAAATAISADDALISRPTAASPASTRLEWPMIAWSIYAAGALLLFARLVMNHLYARRLVSAAEEITTQDWARLLEDCGRRLGVGRAVRLLRASSDTMPMVVGLRRPAILLAHDADTWMPERRRAVLLHELAHVQRHDCLTQTVASLATVLYWPHPGVWWAARRLQVEREFACDDRVLAAGAVADDYASDLLEIAYTLGGRRSPALAVTMARRGQLEGRLLAVLDTARNRATPGSRGRLLAAIATAAVLVPLAAVGITTHAAALPLGDHTALSDMPTEPPAEHSHASHASVTTRQSPGRLAPALYSWSDALQQTLSTSGTWSIQPTERAGEVYLEMRQLHSSSGQSMPLTAFQGLTADSMRADGQAKFTLRRDAGTFTFEGLFRGGSGGGTYSYAPNPGFGDELAKRGIARPTPTEQYEMAKHDVGLAFVDELRKQGYQTPTPEQLVASGHHGVGASYVGDLGTLGYKLGNLAALITMRDHGVTPDYVRALATEGLPKLSADDLVRARDHGVTPDFVQALKQLGFSPLNLEGLVTARDHGITADYVSSMKGLGYTLTLDELRRARDHGVTPDYVRGLSDLGYGKLALAALINGRDHGVTTDFVRELHQLGYTPTLDELVNARDHGITPEYVRSLADLGYSRLALDDLITLRDHGATPERVKRANDKAGAHLSPDMLRTVMDGGLR